MWLHTHAQERSTKRRNAELIIGICILIYSLHIKKKKYKADGSPFLPYTIYPRSLPPNRRLPLFHVHLLWLQYQNAPLSGSAAGVHGGVRNLRPHLLLFITSPVDYTRSTIQSLKIVTHEKTQCLISSLMCHCTDGQAAVIAAIRNLSFCPLHTPARALRRKGDRQSLSSHPSPITHGDIEQPSPPLCTLCLKRHLQRRVLWVVGGKGKKGIFTYRAVAGS